MDQQNKNRLGYQAGIVSLLINTVLFIIKYWAGLVSGSLALIADAWHTLSDSLTSIVVIMGIRFSSKKPDREHPFGHGRWEQISAIFIGFILAVVAYEFIKDAYLKFQLHESANFGTVAIIVTIISILVKEALAQYAAWIGRKTGNDSVKADAWHHRSDALSSLVILAGIILGKYFWWIDSLLGVLVSIMLIIVAYKIVNEAINKLLGEEPSSVLLAEIRELINTNIPEHIFPHHFHIHNYGNHKELTFHIKVAEDLSILEGHEMATRIELLIKQKFNIDTTIHVEPIRVNH